MRNVIRLADARVSSQRCFVLIAIICAVAARTGSEIAARSTWVATLFGPIAFDGAARLVWWSVVAGCIAAAVLARHKAQPIGRWCVAIFVVVACHGATQWHVLSTPRTGEFSGVAYARSDAVPRNFSLSVVLEVEGENFRLTMHGRDRGKLRNVRMGDAVVIDAQRVVYDVRRLRFSAGRHVQGELRDATVHAVAPPRTLWYRGANRIHALIDRGTRMMQRNDAALVRGFVLGDESQHPSAMTEAFRGAGLGHLLAVSGQNVALLLAALTPGLRRLSRWPRLSVALGVVAMFAVITRLESSVVRAAVMAGVVQVGFAIGRDVVPLRALAMTVIGILTVDPLAIWSVGFVLSVAATAGLVVITPHLGESIFAATTAAQLGVAPFALLWFGALPSIALITNVLAVPVASAVMIAAPLLLAVAAVTPDTVAGLLAIPIAAAVRWVWWVAHWGTRVSPQGVANVMVWCGIAAGIIWHRRRR